MDRISATAIALIAAFGVAAGLASKHAHGQTPDNLLGTAGGSYSLFTPDVAVQSGLPAISGNPNKVLTVNAQGTALEWTDKSGGGAGGATSFTGLSDTPANYTGAGGRAVRVKVDASGLEFVSFTPATTYLNLTDTPRTYSLGQSSPTECPIIGLAGTLPPLPDIDGSMFWYGLNTHVRDGTLAIPCVGPTHYDDIFAFPEPTGDASNPGDGFAIARADHVHQSRVPEYPADTTQWDNNWDQGHGSMFPVAIVPLKEGGANYVPSSYPGRLEWKQGLLMGSMGPIQSNQNNGPSSFRCVGWPTTGSLNGDAGSAHCLVLGSGDDNQPVHPDVQATAGQFIVTMTGADTHTNAKLIDPHAAILSGLPAITGQAGKVLAVNSAQDAVVWSAPAGGGTTFSTSATTGGTANAAGTAATVSRGDHAHGPDPQTATNTKGIAAIRPVPEPPGGTDRNYLEANGNRYTWQRGEIAPAYTTANKDQCLRINQLGTGISWRACPAGGGGTVTYATTATTGGTANAAGTADTSSRGDHAHGPDPATATNATAAATNKADIAALNGRSNANRAAIAKMRTVPVAADQGKIVRVTADVGTDPTEFVYADVHTVTLAGLPAITGQAGKVLQVNTGATGVEWAAGGGGEAGGLTFESVATGALNASGSFSPPGAACAKLGAGTLVAVELGRRALRRSRVDYSWSAQLPAKFHLQWGGRNSIRASFRRRSRRAPVAGCFSARPMTATM